MNCKTCNIEVSDKECECFKLSTTELFTNNDLIKIKIVNQGFNSYKIHFYKKSVVELSKYQEPDIIRYYIINPDLIEGFEKIEWLKLFEWARIS